MNIVVPLSKRLVYEQLENQIIQLLMQKQYMMLTIEQMVLSILKQQQQIQVQTTLLHIKHIVYFQMIQNGVEVVDGHLQHTFHLVALLGI